VKDKWDHLSGQALLAFAAVWHRWLASDAAVSRLKLRRNLALSAANRRGVPMDALAARLGLTKSWIRSVLRDPRREAAKAAGLKEVPPLPADEQLPDAG
jgi:hypothetical protein